ncbi:hypothetical protein METP3_01150 [Methanosarcinales archaeon]|nr:hypothetical protein METP3_01150 [Methanosarcinales archaeon]
MYEQEIRKGIIYLIISIVVPTMALGLLYENKNMYIATFAFLILIAYLIFNIYIILVMAEKVCDLPAFRIDHFLHALIVHMDMEPAAARINI